MKVQTFLGILLILSYFEVSWAQTQPDGVNTNQQSDKTPAYLCNPNYIFNDQICMACQVINNGKCTCKTYNGCDSLTCDDQYYQVGQTCVSIPDKNCIKGGIAADGTSIVCYTCQSGSTLIGGICISNNNCDTFDLSTGICTKCSNGYYNVMAEFVPNEYYDSSPSPWQQSNYPQYYQYINQCISCNANSSCKTCNYLKQCTSCIDGWFLQGTTCTQCTSGCQECDNQDTCKTCSQTYNKTSANKCTNCQNNQYWDTQGQQCQNCSTMTDCNTCSSSNYCTSCGNQKYALNGSCISCTNYPQNCSACNAQGACVDCSTLSPMSILNTSNTCYKCPTNCFSVANCSFKDSTTTICSLCQDLYYVTSQGQCAKCDSTDQPNALRCNYDGTKVVYTQCKQNYFLINNQCIQAIANNTCSKLLQQTDQQVPSSDWNKYCGECWPGYTQSGSTCYKCNYCQNCSLNTNNVASCSQCVNGYYPDSNSVCQLCISNCSSCTGPAIGDCSNCSPGFIKNGNNCTACTTDGSNNTTCLVCQDTNNCTTCINGFYNVNGQCLACQYGCSQCIGPGNQCQTCITGYYLQNGGCVQDDANCLSTDQTKLLSSLQQTASNGCQICNYGFYLTTGWLTQSAASQIQNNVCMQCVYPQTAFVCRTNPMSLQVSSVQTVTTTTLNTAQYFSKGAVVPNIQNQITPRYTQATCITGYFWNNQSCMPCMTIANGQCSSCTNLTSCASITCSDSFFLITMNNNQICVPIPTGCSELTYSTTLLALACTKCNTGYTLVGNICIQINGCQTINQSNGICTQCQDGYYFNWDFYWSTTLTNAPKNNANYYQNFNKFCSPCNAGCQTCPSLYTCTQCLPGYFWFQSTQNDHSKAFVTYSSTQNANYYGQCVKCPKYCLTCTSYNSCSTCYPNFTPDPSSTVGDCMCPTANGYTLTSTVSPATCTQQGTVTQACQIPACSQCSTDNASCLTCLPQFQGKAYTLQNSNCVTCSLYCNQCQSMTGSTSQTTCTVCANGYYMTQSSNDQPVICTACPQQGALLCQGPLENSTYAQVTVIQCQNNFYLYNGVCVNVPNTPTCYTVSSTTNGSTCQQCLPGYTLFNSTCQTCSKNPQCLTCNANSDNTGLQCTSCQTGYIIDTQNNVCVACSAGCSKCSLSQATPQNNQQKTSCSNCSDGNFLDNSSGTCSACPYKCKTCDSRYTCTICLDGYYLKQSQTTINNKQLTFKPCYPCQQNCATCSGPYGNTCLTCSTGYVLQNGGCVNLFSTPITVSPPENPNTQNSANCYQLDTANGGCLNCLAGFYLDPLKICQECVSPYNNFVCGLKAVSPTNPVTPGPGPTPSPGTDTTPTVQIGVNPVPPNSYTIILGMLIIIVLQ